MATQLLRIPEVAQALGCSRKHVYDLIAAGRLTAVNVGIGRSQSRISEAELARYVRASTYGRTAAGA